MRPQALPAVPVSFVSALGAAIPLSLAAGGSGAGLSALRVLRADAAGPLAAVAAAAAAAAPAAASASVALTAHAAAGTVASGGRQRLCLAFLDP